MSEEENQSETDYVQKESIGFSTDYMDKSADPITDFYSYSAGSWIKKHPVPSDQSAWAAFSELIEKNGYMLKSILEDCTGSQYKGYPERMLGDFYLSAMNTDKLESLKFEPIFPYLEISSSVKSRSDFMKALVKMHQSGIFPLFYISSRTDEKNSSIYALYFEQGGLSLPDRDYYLEDSFSEIRDYYLKHLEKIFSIAGDPEESARANAEKILSIETGIARESRSQVELRDAEKNYNRISISDLDGKFPELGLTRYIEAMGVPAVEYVVVGQPEFFAAIDHMISESSPEELALYLRWNVLNTGAPYLFAEIENEHFDMFNRKIRGQKDPEPRWKRAVRIVDACVGEALGKIYTHKHFGSEAEKRMSVLISDIREVFRSRLSNLSWMSEDTRKQAIEKFDRFKAKIGHPAVFRDYSTITVEPVDYMGNIRRSITFEVRRQMKRVGLPVDRNEWYMTPPTVNAYFSPPENEIVFPAGILQPPFFDVDADDAVNYGGIGAVISHEITHGYDDQGRRYDKEGNLRDWWTPQDEARFLEKAKGVITEYGNQEILPGLKVNGELTLGENIADLGGVSIAFEALQRHLDRHLALRRNIDGLSPEQRFFISWAQVWRNNAKEQELRMRITVDPHSPGKFRAVLPVYNHPEFERVFGGTGNSSANKMKIGVW